MFVPNISKNLFSIIILKVIKEESSESLRRRWPTGPEAPVHYPNGWLPILESKELKKGEVKHIFAVGHDLVIYRGQSGRVHVFDAFCPHLGANLGVGGTVIGDQIKCPFHGWQFNDEGKCASIPGVGSK